MSEVKEVCPKCSSATFGILRDMTSRRVCKCGNTWDAPEKKDTGYKRLKRESEEYFSKWGEYMKRSHVAEAKVEELKTKLDKAEAVISFYANKRHWDYTRIQMVEDMEMHGFGNLGGFKAREYLKGEG